MNNLIIMFEERMSSGQLFEEYYADLQDIQVQTINFDQTDYVLKYLWKRRKKLQVAITKVFTSQRGNRYLGILVYVQTGEGQQKQWNWTSFHIGLMDTSKGVCAIAFYVQSQQAIKFTPHFFHRYQNRFCKICDWQTRSQLELSKSSVDIIAIYMKRNLSMTWIETRSVFRNKVHIFGPVNDGVALLQWDKYTKLLQANTFVTMDMLDKKQTEMVNYARIYSSLSMEQRMKFKYPDFILDDENSIN